MKTIKLLDLFNGAQFLDSSALIDKLQSSGMSRTAARKVLQRDRTLLKTKCLKLESGRRLYFKGAISLDNSLLEELVRFLIGIRSGIARVLLGLQANDILHYSEVMKLLSVAKRGSVKRNFYREKEALIEVGVRVIDFNGSEFFYLNHRIKGDKLEQAANDRLAVVQENKAFSEYAESYLQKMNLVSWNGGLVDEKKAYTECNGQIYTNKTFSHTSGLKYGASGKKLTPTLVVIDSYSYKVSLFEVEAFIDRVGKSSNRGRLTQPIQGVIIADTFEKDALTRARGYGLIVIIFSDLFGKRLAEQIRELTRLCTLASSTSSGQLFNTQYESFLCKLGLLRDNPIITKLISDSFELLVGYYFQKEGYSVKQNKVVKLEVTKKREIDVSGVRNESDLVVVECKAYRRDKPLDEDEIKKFFTESFSAARKDYNTSYSGIKSWKGYLWTTGSVSTKNLEYFRELNLKTSMETAIFAREDVIARVQGGLRNNLIKLIKIIDTVDVL